MFAGIVKQIRMRGFAAAHLLSVSALLLLATAPAVAGSFNLSPTRAEVPAGKTMATFHLRNFGSTPLTVQVETRRWTQSAGEDVYAPADDLMVVPPLARIPPRGQQIVRIARKGAAVPEEAAYRVAFREVPPEPGAGFVGVQTALELDAPLFFTPKAPRRELVWRAKRQNGRLHLTAENRGNHYARFAQFRVLDTDGRVLAENRSLTYVLAGATRYWTLPAKDLPAGTALRLVIGSGAGQQELPLSFN